VPQGLCRTEGSRDADGILNYINYMMSQIWIKYIKINRLKWVGNAIQIDNNRIVKRMFDTKPERKRGIETPKLR
jgi:hypothetical protein